MSGSVGEGIQYRLKMTSSPTQNPIHRNLCMVYTGSADLEVDIHNAGGGLSILFAGVAYTGWPYTEAVGFFQAASPYVGTNLSVVPSDDQWITVTRSARIHCIAAEDISAGNFIMTTDLADGSTQQHDGMVSPVNTGDTGEMDSVIGIAEMAADAASSHDTHTWDWNTGEFSDHPQFIAVIFR